ncbi:MAG TPA: hypothetical protein VFE10_00435 [Phenylobacterium sp.]|jgi:hypothetical protein|nr:hypothetical protein [Phenylobacterium sp.]
MTWKPINTAPTVGGGSAPPYRFGPWILVRNATRKTQARWRARTTGLDSVTGAATGRWEDRDGDPLAFAPEAWREMSEQEIADVTAVLAQIAETIDEPPSTAAFVEMVGRKLEGGLERLGRTGDAACLIAMDPGDFQTIVTLRALGERLFVLGRSRGPGAGLDIMNEALSTVLRGRDRHASASFDVIASAWNGIGKSANDGGWQAPR